MKMLLKREENGKLAIAVRYNMENYLRQTVRRFVTMAGNGTTLKYAATPFLPEDHKHSPQGVPGDGPLQECPWCKHTFPPQRIFKALSEYEEWKRQEKTRKGTPQRLLRMNWECCSQSHPAF